MKGVIMEKNTSTVEENKKSSSAVRNIMLFIIFFIFGGVLGYFGTTKYLDSKKDITVEDTSSVTDITENSEYAKIIETLHNFVLSDINFYNSKGVDASSINNDVKLTLIYNSIINDKTMFTTETIPTVRDDSGWYTTCANEFTSNLNNGNALDSTNTCSINRINKDNIIKTSKKMFNNEVLDLSVGFNPKNNMKCVVDNQSYICGTISVSNDVTGELKPKFDIKKVTLDLDGNLKIYDKGYLVDTRSDKINQNGQYDNYYLHSSDSTSYYYELKSSDNLTFVHTFKTDNNKDYYYVSSEVEKE